MDFVVSINSVLVTLLVLGGLLCVALYFGLAQHRPLAWLAAALVIAAIEVFSLGVWPDPWLQMGFAALALPLSLLCVAEGVREIYGEKERLAVVYGVVALLSVTAGVMAFAHFPYAMLRIPFELSLIGGVTLSAFYVSRARIKHTLDLAIIATCLLFAGLSCFRLIAYTAIFADDMALETVRASDLDRILLTLFGVLSLVLAILLVARALSARIAEYRQRSERDYLTGLYNRGGFERLADRRLDRTGTLILCDLDLFKQVNDTHGHLMGDGAICVMAALLQDTGLPAGRVGGEEFALFASGWDSERAARLAEELRTGFTRECRESLAIEESLTASFGVAQWQANERWRAVVDRADRALYLAKNSGRDRVEIA